MMLMWMLMRMRITVRMMTWNDDHVDMYEDRDDDVDDGEDDDD